MGRFKASPDVLCVLDGHDVIVEASRSVGTSPLVGAALVDVVHETCRVLVAEALAAVRRTRSARQLDVAVARAGDPGMDHYQLSIAPYDGAGDRLAVVAADINARKQVEDRLRHAEALMTDIAATARLGTWEWTPNATRATWSPGLYRIYGLAPDATPPTYEEYIATVYPEDRARVFAATEAMATSHQPFSHDERIRLPDGKTLYLHTWAHAILNPQGELVRVIGICQDVTEHKLAEVALEQRALELARANARLREETEERARVERLLARSQKLEAIGRFSAGIAHDVNNMLGVIVGYASLLGRRITDAKQREHVTEIMSVVERAGRLTNQLLTFSHEQTIASGSVELDSVVGELARLLHRMAGDKVEVILDLHATAYPGEPALVVDGTPSQIEQLLMNLAVNARDAMPDGGTFTVTTRGNAAHAIITVVDTGTGMTEDVLAQIFDPFFTTKPVGRGTGLGLSTVYGIVKQNGGTITVASRPGVGTRFEIHLPRSTGPAELGVPHVTSSGGTETILLVEDEPDLRAVVRNSMEAYGYHVIEASDAAAALELGRSHPTIHLLLTDMVMPRMTGPELAELLRKDRPSLCVVFMSGYSADAITPTAQPRARALRKPFSAGELAREVRELLDGALA